MRYLFLLLAGLLAFSPASLSWAVDYSCRDSKGTLHFGDNLMYLPEECLDKYQKLKQGKSDRLQFVPSPPDPPKAGQSFKRAVTEENNRLKTRDRLAQSLGNEAKVVAEKYMNAATRRKSALKRWNYGARDVVVKSQNEMDEAVRAKAELLDKIENSNLTTRQKQSVKSELSRIP